jgi:hypothetical protein
MKRLLSIVLLGGAMLAPTTWAMMVTTVGGSGYGPYQRGEGGEFTLRVSSDLTWVLDNYSSKARNVQGLANTFQTFCVEKSEYIYPNSTYQVEISDATRYTGKSLTLGAAWLYYEFATGGLAGYDYSSTRSTALALQNAIWWLMGSQSQPANNLFVTETMAEFGTTAEALKANNGTYGVSVLNMWASGGLDRQGYQRQDQLVLTHVPDSGTTAGLLGLGCGGIALLVRRRAFAC